MHRMTPRFHVSVFVYFLWSHPITSVDTRHDVCIRPIDIQFDLKQQLAAEVLLHQMNVTASGSLKREPAYPRQGQGGFATTKDHKRSDSVHSRFHLLIQ